MTISAIVHTYNEEDNIRACLDTLRFADEIVVVDNESVDRTVELAEKAGARVLKYPGAYGYPEPARVYGLTQLQGDWVFILDADERVTPELQDELLRMKTQSNAYDGYWIPIRNHHFGRWLKHGGLYPDWHLRFFRREKGTYPEVGLHRGIRVNGTSGRAKGEILHYSYRDINHYFEKFNIYTTLEAERIASQARRPTGYDLILKPGHRFIKAYVFHAGFRDGLAGLLFHLFSSAYVFVSEAKAWDEYRKQGETLPILRTLFTRKRGKRN